MASWNRARRFARMGGTPAYSSPASPSLPVPSPDEPPNINTAVFDCTHTRVAPWIGYITFRHTRFNILHSLTPPTHTCHSPCLVETCKRATGQTSARCYPGTRQRGGVEGGESGGDLDVLSEVSRSTHCACQHLQQVRVVEHEQFDAPAHPQAATHTHLNTYTHTHTHWQAAT